MAPPQVLAPGPNQPNNPAPPPVGQGAQIVPLQAVLQVVKTTYIDPRSDTETALPPHRWEVQQVKDPKIVTRGALSDAQGVSKILDAPEIRAAKADEKWFLSLRPELDDPDLSRVRAQGEVWIDLDKNAWVVPTSFPDLEKRKLLRIPLWTSRWKVKLGGFKKNLGKDFDKDGSLRSDELTTASGTVAAPWEIQVDFGWLRTFVRFQYYDVKQKKTLVVPPGLCLQALGNKLDPVTLATAKGRVGAGTRIDDDGTICVLSERTMEGSFDMELGFDNFFAEESVIDLGAAADAASKVDDRLIRETIKSRDPEKFYKIPNAWSTLGMEGHVGAGARAKWTALRPTPKGAAKPVKLDTTKASPLFFHLDDIVFVDHGKGPVTIAKDARVTIFDRRLRFRGPFDAVMVPLWSGKLAENYGRAEDVYCKDGDAWKDLGFVFNHEADFFVLRDARVSGTLGTTKFLGARQAEARSPENPIGNFLSGYPNLNNDGTVELHLIPDAYPGPYTAADEGKFLEDHPKAKLCHLLVYVPIKVIKHPVNPAANINPVFQELINAGDRWDQAHPATGAAGKKDYVVIPEAGVNDDTRVIKLRHFFGSRTDGNHKFTIQCASTIPPDNRSFVQGKTMTLLVSGAGPILTDHAQDSDGVDLPWFTLAHEMGHVLGLPDEYAENLDLSAAPALDTLTEPRVPRFGQRDPGYPFYADQVAMERSNKLPRQRYNWHHIQFLNNGAKAKLPEGPYVGAYPAFDGGTTHKMPDGNTTNPWKPFGQGAIKSGRATVVLYGCGDDEGTVERMLKRPAANGKKPGEWMNGIAIVRTKFWFNFLASTAGDFANDPARWTVVRDQFYAKVYDPDAKPLQRFWLDGPPAARLPRIAVLFQPWIEFGPRPNPRSGAAPPNVTEADADIVVDVLFQTAAGPVAAPKNPPKTGAKRLLINKGDVGLSLLRHALGVAPVAPATVPSNGAIVVADLAQVAAQVETLMSCGPGTYLVKDMP
ncbi:MAG: hypothetical protein U0359_36255 [Byssovorax sp.]